MVLYADSPLKDTESLRITVGNDLYFGCRDPPEAKTSAMDRLGPRADRSQEYAHQHPQTRLVGMNSRNHICPCI